MVEENKEVDHKPLMAALVESYYEIKNSVSQQMEQDLAEV
jgi:hypothetical protein